MARKFYLEEKKSYEINEQFKVDGEEFLHIANVLRKKVGENIVFFDGNGNDVFCKILSIEKKNLFAKVENIEKCSADCSKNLTIFQALLKKDKNEFLVQKLTEIGVKKVCFFSSVFCMQKASNVNLERLEKINTEALKQCGGATKMQFEKVFSFAQMIAELERFERVLVAYEKSDNDFKFGLIKEDNVAIIVGSEGGFSADEIAELSKLKNVEIVGLGKRILRAETASVVLAGIGKFLMGEM